MNPFKKPNAAELAEIAVEDALRCQLEHSMAAEHHAALADMYAARAKRLMVSVEAPANVKQITKGRAA